MMSFCLKKIVAVEMNPYTYSRLQFNIIHNVHTHDKPVLLNEAVCGIPGSYSINFGRGSTSDSLYGSSGNGKTTEIKGRTIDQIYENYFPNEIINVCKIDVEGAEFEKKIPIALEYIEYIIMGILGNQEQDMALLTKLQKNNFRLLNSATNTNNVFFLKNENINNLPTDE